MSKELDEAAEAYVGPVGLGLNGLRMEAFKSGATWALRESPEVKALVEALNWIGAIAVAPKDAWPTQEMCTQHANEALSRFKVAAEGK